MTVLVVTTGILSVIVIVLFLAGCGMAIEIKRLRTELDILKPQVDALARLATARTAPQARPSLMHPLDVTIIGREPGRPQ